MLTLEKLQGHSEAEEGVSIEQVKGRRGAGLQTPTYIKAIVSTQRQSRSTEFGTEQHTQGLLKCTATTKETFVSADYRECHQEETWPTLSKRKGREVITKRL